MRRIIFVIAIFLLTLSPLMGQTPQVVLPEDGNWPTIVGDSIMLIGPKQEALTEEQRYFNPPYLIVYPGKEHLKEQMIRAGLCDCDPTKPNRRIGVFSVAPDKQVSFSQGNLQYLPAANIWKFADTQYEYLGNANKYLKPTFRNWVDLFGWSANNTTAPFGVSTSTNAADYAGTFVDWGTNEICGDAPNTWRTLSADEWEYLLKKRKNASDLYGVAQVAGVNGMIILPDDWEEANGIVFKSGLHSSQVNDYSVYQSFTADEWKVMEEAGAVFLHASGYRDGATVEKCNTSGYYWSNTTSNGDDAYRMYFYSYFLGPKDVHSKYRGRSVRLVHDTIVPPPAPCETFKVNGVTFNMMCVEGGTFMMGSNDSSAPSNTRPAHPVTLSDFHIGQTEVTRALWRAVMDTVPGSGTDDMPVGHVTWEECQVFLTKLSEMTGKHFRLPTEAEWEYAARGGNKNKDFIYSGSDYADVVGWINYESNKIMPVAQKRCNQLGIYDMTGNSWEWCQDGGCRSYTTDSVINPIYVGASTGHVIRGGSFRTEPARCTNIARSTYGQNKGDSHISLRLVMDTVFPSPAPAKRIGVFSVAKDKQVSFSQGNLQYIQSTDTWQFAREQYEYMGEKHYRNGQLADTIEYFGWSGKNSKAPWGISLSIESSDYAGEFLDWGTNTIAGSAPNTWRTLSNDEWLYICQRRKNADQLLGLGTIGAVTGLIILPDDWQLPAGLSFTPNTDNATKNQYTYNQWAVMENAGAVFIATSGYFNPKLGGMRHVGGEGHIRTNALSDNGLQVYSVFKTNKIIYSYSGTQEQNLQYAFAQRLVHDTIVPTPEPEYVDLGLSVKWATFNVGATSPEDYGDYFAWGETEPKETYSWATYKWCDGTDANITKYNSTDGKTILEPADDAAQVHWGGKWRMPTKDEIEELIDNCTWSESIQNGVKGYVVTSKHTGNSIFFPYSGYFNHDNSATLQGEKTLFYTWSSEHSDNTRAYDIHNRSGAILSEQNTRRCGFPIRPVYDDRPPKRIGVFSIAADKQVSFSQGNLQYIQSTDTWQFAREQYEYIGAANIKDGALADRIDMFGWSANNTTAPFGVSTSTNAADYAGDFVDWGTNTICGNAPNTWRTLSKDEWDYVLNERENAQQLRTKGSVEGKEGVILLPDSWICPEGYTIAIIPDEANLQPNVNTYSQADWSKLEDAGAIILPSAGMRRNAIELEVRHPNIFGGYWTCTNKDEHNSYCYTFHTQDCEYVDYSNHIYGRSVRLVHDTIVPETIPDPCLVVKVNDTLSINMMCVEGGTFQMGATPEMDPDALAHEAPVHSVTLSDYYIGQIEVTQALWKTVMGTNPSTVKDNNRPVNNVSWEDCQVFIEKLNQTTGYSFRLPTEAEWEYAARGGNKSRGYKYAGSDNIDEVAWYKDNSGGKYQPFALKKPNELGIYDMSGNVFEWCQDWYGPYSADAQVNPQGPESGPYHMIRGGGWKHTQSNRVTYRRTTGANLDITSIGLRLVHDTIVPPPEPEYVDLGLSVKWATFNVGATSPEDYGDYFAWGETEPKETYSWATYKWGTSSNLTKYNTTDGKTTLEPEDDAAYVNWGGKWRMPTKEEMHELFDKCTWTEETRNGINGHIVTGPNGNSIFLPIAGFYNKDEFGEGIQKANINAYYWTNSKTIDLQSRAYDLGVNTLQGEYGISLNTRRLGFPIRPVYDDRPTLTVIPTPEDAKVSFLCTGYQAQGHSIKVDKGQNVLYQVTNVDSGYLSQGDSIYNLTKDTTLYVTLRPFSDGNWVKVDKSEYTKQEGYYVSRNNGGFASHSVWNYYVLPVLPGETYRMRGIAGQHAALWMAASTAPDPATNTRPTKISCCANRGVAAYVADEVTIPDGAKYLIINSRNGQEMMVERKVPDPCLVVKVNDTLSINLMCVEGGTFRMGAMEGDTQANANEKPAHEVTLTYDYLIMQTEVTQGLWEAVMGEDIYDLISKSPTPTAKPISTKGDFPVGYVQLSQCLEFIDRLNALTGLHFRMPTEAEWEYAARGGNQSKGYLYAGSNDITQVAQTSLGTVAKLLPNELGIYDMSGNIAEMTLDYLPNHDTGYPSATAQVNPRQISPTGNRAIRGLRWNTTEINCRISHRNAYTTTYSGNGMGFRLVLSNEQNFRTIHINGSYFDMSFVKGGTFMMGSDAPDAQADEQPVHEVTLSDYYIGQTEVTQHLWKKVMGDDNNPSATKGNNLPVTNITWDEAQVFVEKLSEMTGMHFRLPTEAEWEYAARGGQKSKGYTYAGSDNIDEVGWYNGNSSNKTHAVGQKQPNELGIYDMTGNIWEYCFDWHTPYSAQAQTNPTGAATGEKHVLRGGCYHYDSKNCTNTNRHSYYTPDKGGASTGLRIVLEPQRYYRYGFTQEDWDAATSSWGHAGRGHAPADQSCIQGTMVHGIRLKVAKAGSLNVYKVPSLLEKNEDHFELVATLTTDSTGLQDFDFAEPIYIAPNEYLVFGKPSEEEPTLRPCYINISRAELPAKAKGFAHYIGTEKAKVAAPNGSLMVEFY